MGTRLGLRSLIQFLQSMANMSSAGLPAARALTTVARQSHDLRVRRATTIACEQISGGASLTQALSASRAFPAFMIGMIEVAEEAGVLDDILRELADYYDWKLKMRRTLIRNAAYPVIMIPIALVLMSVFLVVMDKVFGGSGFSGFLTAIVTIGVVVAALIFGVFFMRSGLRDLIKKFPGVGRFGRSLPVFGKLFAKITMGNFTNALYLCVRAGVPIVQGLRRAGAASGSATIEAAAIKAAESAREGATLREAFERTRTFPLMFLEVIQVAEESGKLEERLHHLAIQLQEETRFAVEVAVKVMSVLFYLAIAAGVGAMIVIGYVRLFSQMYDAAGM